MDLEKNNLHIENEDGLIKVDERNANYQGQEFFSENKEDFVVEENKRLDDSSNLLGESSNKKEKKEEKHTQNDESLNSSASNATSGLTSSFAGVSVAIPGIAVTLVAAVVGVGTATGLIKVQPSNYVNVFMSRSTSLGFEINKDIEKQFKVFLTNADNNFTQELTSINQFVFDDLSPNTVYELTVYDDSVDPMKKVFSSNYQTKDHDNYSAYFFDTNVDNDYLTFSLDYEGENIDYVTITVVGDDGKIIYVYEGAPLEEFTVNIAGHENVTCKVAINGEVTSFGLLFSKDNIVPVTSVSLDKEYIGLKVGESKTLTATVLPLDATNKSLIWASSNETIATVVDGVVSAKKVGVAEITVTTKDGNKVAACQVEVTDSQVVNVSSISLNEESLDLSVGDVRTLVATVLPDNATNKNVNWTSSDPTTVSVRDGRLNALKEGQATITASTVDGNYTATCVVNVTTKVISVIGVQLDVDELEINVGETKALIATVLPNGATNKDVTWSSTNSEVASVDENGVVTAHKVGQAIIVVKTVDGEYQDYCVVNVK